jgi:hypothetical protein
VLPTVLLANASGLLRFRSQSPVDFGLEASKEANKANKHMSVGSLTNDGSDTLYSVQYLRAVAAILVVFFHISELSQETWGLDPDRVDHVGAAGVDLFFVISGFIMAMIIDRPGVFNGQQFWIRRFARVAPAYWVVTLFVFRSPWLCPACFTRRRPVSVISLYQWHSLPSLLARIRLRR